MGAIDPGAMKKPSLPSERNKHDCKVVFPNGNKYIGEMKDGEMDGHGVLYYRNGDIYKGEWRKNKISGFGTYFYNKEQKKYVGFWKDDLYDGEGTIYDADGSYFMGNFLEGEKHGKGKYVDAQGDEYEEEWKDGDLQGRLLRINSKHDDEEDRSLDSNKKKNGRFRDDEDEDNHLASHRSGTDFKPDMSKSLEEEQNDSKDESKKKNNQNGKELDKKVQSNILFKSTNDFESGEGRTYEFGLETLNIIEHIDMLNSVAGALLAKNIVDWTIDDVCEWLRHLGLDEYIQKFKDNHITGQILFDITETELKDDFKMMSVGHRKNFMKAIANLQKIFSGHAGKNSEYIKQKIHKFYEKNKPKNNKMGLLNSFGSAEGRFYSHRFNSKNFYSCNNNQIIEEEDDQSVKLETNPSPTMNPKNDPDNVEPFVLCDDNKKPHTNESSSENINTFEIDEDMRQMLPKGSKEEFKTSLAKENNSTQPKLAIETKTISNKPNAEAKQNQSRSSDSKIGSPLKKDPSSDRQQLSDKGEDHKLEENSVQQQQTAREDKYSGPLVFDSSDTSSASESSDEEKAKEPIDEKIKEESPIVDAPKPLKPDQKNDKKHKKNLIQIGSKTKLNPYKDGKKPKKAHQKKIGDEDINQRIKEEILREFKESGLNENFIINYNELFFEKKIGEGGYGRVYLGKFSGIEVAIKEYGKRRLDERCAEDFVKEVKVISNLRHPNIVLYMGACIHNGKYLMITEYLEEGSLFDHLHKKHTKITDDVAFSIIEDIALGMCYLHGRKVLHCDLKSSNILIDSTWEVKLCDFGLSRVKYKSDKKRFSKQRVGTPHWMAPEILRGEKYDEAADVYSFGMILWELIAGEIPYCNVQIEDIIQTVGHEKKQIPLPTKGHPLILSIMKNCLSLDKNTRPTFKEIVCQLQQRNKGTSVQKKNERFNFFGS